MTTKIKICGLTRDEDVDYVNALQPDYIGMVFTTKSRRFVPPERAVALKARLKPEILSVGVFVNAPLSEIMELVNLQTINLIQLHGSEDETYIKTLRDNLDIPVIQAFSIASENDLKRAKSSIADYVLLDHGTGGTGESFNWRVAQHFDRPFFLAGGLDSCNVFRAIELLSPFAVDVSSGVEVAGVKDFVKMRDFVFQARGDSNPLKSPKTDVML